MEFLAIMFVGTLIAVWAVAGSRPRRRNFTYLPPVIPREMNPPLPPKVWQYDPMDEMEYTEALKRHASDPAHNPFPSQIPYEEQ
jgi:hypothetical protein